jgi:type II secretory pathway pseudopilin PulG
MAMYRALDADKIIATIERLKRRIDERFPGAGLACVAGDLLAAAHDTEQKATSLRRQRWSYDLLPVLFLAICIGSALYLQRVLKFEVANTEGTNLLQTFEAVLNIAVFGGIALVYLLNLQRQQKRREALNALHQLRSLVHVIDMHQLTKDPSLVLGGEHDTAASPKRKMTAFELGRYLDYSSEMLSLAGKVAALYAQDLDDPVVVEAVNDIEMLATNLSRKIWQKIAILQSAVHEQMLAKVLTE